MRSGNGPPVVHVEPAMRLFLGAVLASLALTACDGTAAGPAPGGAPVSSSAAPPVAGEGLADVTDCGYVTLRQGELLPESAGRCLIDAVRARNPARLRVTRPSVEGSMIPITYTAGVDGNVRVVTDYRQDGYSSPIITSQTCTGPKWSGEEIRFTTCSEPTPLPS